jgi:hypothetical protein
VLTHRPLTGTRVMTHASYYPTTPRQLQQTTPNLKPYKGSSNKTMNSSRASGVRTLHITHYSLAKKSLLYRGRMEQRTTKALG